VFHFDAADTGYGILDFETTGGVVDVVCKSSFHGRKIADEVHG
jgi:hypothetical protein